MNNPIGRFHRFSKVAVFAAALALGCAGTPNGPREEHPVVGAEEASHSCPSTWSYAQPQGTAQGWTGMCATGQKQSPIELDTGSATPGAPIVEAAACAPFPVSITNEGYTVSQHIPDGMGVFRLAGELEPYVPFELHLHTPSEHTLASGGFTANIEAHIKAKNKEGRAIVFAILFDTSSDVEDPALHQILANVPDLGVCKTLEPSPPLLMDITPWIAPFLAKPPVPYLPSSYFHYPGSLTTPPCDEGFDFYVRSRPLPASVRQMDALRAMLRRSISTPTNARNTQRTNPMLRSIVLVKQ
jgi:carbonic anhydrase